MNLGRHNQTGIGGNRSNRRHQWFQPEIRKHTERQLTGIARNEAIVGDGEIDGCRATKNNLIDLQVVWSDGDDRNWNVRFVGGSDSKDVSVINHDRHHRENVGHNLK
jgi:hypothetical protein